jgi:type VI secretion system protein
MGRERTVLERLSDPRANEPLTIQENTDQLAESVLRHLSNMLNTRHGHTLTLPDYGLPDLVDLFHAFPEAIGLMQKAIRDTIEKYEPRLRNVRINLAESEEDMLNLHFEVTAELVTAQERASVLFETSIDTAGQVRVSG